MTTTKKLAERIGEVARSARIQAGLTQADVAERIGIATEVYGRVERGGMMPSVPKLRRFCEVLNLDANVVLGLAAPEDRPLTAPPPSVKGEEPIEVRRLVRRVRGLPAHALRVLSQMAGSMQRLMGGTAEEDEETSGSEGQG